MSWEEIVAKLPLEKTEKQKQERAKIFEGFDPNGNGYVSLAECDRGCRDILGLGDVLPKPVIMRAYQASKDTAQKDGKNMTKNGGDYIERNEFRLFLVYLSRYLQLWQMFSNMDDDSDRRVTFEEFEKGVAKLAEWGVTTEDPKAKFDEIDTNSGGVILFDEFSKWAMEALLQAEKD
eukprot:scaffold1170_cov174-Amphora_coffeaeformis.AAC.15